MTERWHALQILNSLDGFTQSARIDAAWAVAYQEAGKPADMAIFVHTALGAKTITAYFPPRAASLARSIGGAMPCEAPGAHRLGVLKGDKKALQICFPHEPT